MSVLFADSFDGINAGANKWDLWHANNILHTDYGRNGTKGLRTTTQNTTQALKVLPATTKVTVGAWVYMDFSGAMNSSSYIFRLASATSGITLRADDDNRLLIDGTAVGSGPYAPHFTWLFIEFSVEFGTSVELRVNGEVIHSAAHGGSGSIDELQLKHFGPTWYDDLYVTDGAFMGPSQVTNRKPSGNGNRSELVGSDANSTDNYLLVSDGSDSTYVESDTNGDGDSYAFEDLASSEDVLAVVMTWRAFDPVGGGASMKSLVRSGATDYFGTAKVLAGSEVTYIESWETDPDTGSAWTPAGVDAAEFGVEVVI